MYCDNCHLWIHIKCADIAPSAYEKLKFVDADWFCPKCDPLPDSDLSCSSASYCYSSDISRSGSDSETSVTSVASLHASTDPSASDINNTQSSCSMSDGSFSSLSDRDPDSSVSSLDQNTTAESCSSSSVHSHDSSEASCSPSARPQKVKAGKLKLVNMTAMASKDRAKRPPFFHFCMTRTQTLSVELNQSSIARSPVLKFSLWTHILFFARIETSSGVGFSSPSKPSSIPSSPNFV